MLEIEPMLCDLWSQTQRAELWKTSGELVNLGIDNQPQMSPCIPQGGVAERSIKCREASTEREAGVVFRQNHTRKTTPSAPAKEASQQFFNGRSHPSLR